jgi:hypothetical protein
MMPMTKCSVNECNNIAKKRDLCSKHYTQWWASVAGGGACSVEGCDKTARTRGLCNKHYIRLLKHNDPLVVLRDKADRGAPQEFIEMALSYQDNKECLFWPFARNNYGYAIMDSNLVSRYMCEKIYGPLPSPIHQAAHSCGKGHLGCVNPHHLEWKTPAGNAADRVIHGTDSRGERSSSAILTWEKAREIKAMKGKFSGYKVAAIYGVDDGTIYAIWNGKTWKE